MNVDEDEYIQRRFLEMKSSDVKETQLCVGALIEREIENHESIEARRNLLAHQVILSLSVRPLFSR